MSSLDRVAASPANPSILAKAFATERAMVERLLPVPTASSDTVQISDQAAALLKAEQA